MMKRTVLQDRLLIAAAEIVASEGLEYATVRRITDAAGVNVASVSTAFGGRDALLDALLVHLLQPVNDERDRRYDEVGGSDIEGVVRAFIEPLITSAEHSRARSMRALSDLIFRAGGPLGPLERTLRDPGTTRFEAELARVAGGRQAHLTAGVRLAVGTTLAFCALSTIPGASDAAAVQRLIVFVAGGLRSTIDEVVA